MSERSAAAAAAAVKVPNTATDWRPLCCFWHLLQRQGWAGRLQGGGLQIAPPPPPQPQLILAALGLITTGQMFDTLSPNHTQHSVTICCLNSFQGDVKTPAQVLAASLAFSSNCFPLSPHPPPPPPHPPLPLVSPPPSFLASRLLGCLLLSARL